MPRGAALQAVANLLSDFMGLYSRQQLFICPTGQHQSRPEILLQRRWQPRLTSMLVQPLQEHRYTRIRSPENIQGAFHPNHWGRSSSPPSEETLTLPASFSHSHDGESDQPRLQSEGSHMWQTAVGTQNSQLWAGSSQQNMETLLGS